MSGCRPYPSRIAILTRPEEAGGKRPGSTRDLLCRGLMRMSSAGRECEVFSTGSLSERREGRPAHSNERPPQFKLKRAACRDAAFLLRGREGYSAAARTGV